ncbi:MAG TPA: GntR family transcriptional regulator [Bacillota bacterium]|nr:GntR family transcriptional regulator [Bacillota bacterium]
MLTKLSSIDKSVPIPLYFQLKQLILSEIQDGNYKSGDMIPTENEISDAFKISRTTVRQAVTELVQEGWLYRVKSKGTFVSLPKINQDFIKKLESFNDQIIRAGMEPSTEVLELKTMPATEVVAKHLEIKENESVIFLYRKRLADGEPIVTIKTYLPYDTCSFVMEHNLEQERLYAILRQSPATTVFRVERIVEAVEATAEDANLLNIKKGKPIQHFTSTGYSTFGKPIEYSLARYRGDRNSFEITVFPENE